MIFGGYDYGYSQYFLFSSSLTLSSLFFLLSFYLPLLFRLPAYYNDTWFLDSETQHVIWIKMETPTQPPSRCSSALAYSEKSDRGK
jgi:hypothetical protein